MIKAVALLFALNFFLFIISSSCRQENPSQVTVPFTLDHNRMLVDAEMQRKDGAWRNVRLWVDSGSPAFTISANLAHDLGIDLPGTDESDLTATMKLEVKVSNMTINAGNIPVTIKLRPHWLFGAMHCDGNLPAAILKRYDVVLDYPEAKLILAEQGSLKFEGIKNDALIHPETGIVQINAGLDGDSLSFALDNGASYSFISAELLSEYSHEHPEWPVMTGTAGYANMWGWWPANEQSFPVVRVPRMKWGNILLDSFGIAGVPKFRPEGPSLGEWYSNKTMKPVNGFLGANVLKPYRVGIDYKNHNVYFEKNALFRENDMDIVGISLRQLPDSTFQVVGVVEKTGKPVIEGIEAGDIIISIDDLKVKGETMGKVVDALRGKPGDFKTLLISRNGITRNVTARVRRQL